VQGEGEGEEVGKGSLLFPEWSGVVSLDAHLRFPLRVPTQSWQAKEAKAKAPLMEAPPEAGKGSGAGGDAAAAGEATAGGGGAGEAAATATPGEGVAAACGSGGGGNDDDDDDDDDDDEEDEEDENYDEDDAPVTLAVRLERRLASTVGADSTKHPLGSVSVSLRLSEACVADFIDPLVR
jgi:hypothetical protein